LFCFVFVESATDEEKSSYLRIQKKKRGGGEGNWNGWLVDGVDGFMIIKLPAY
jgi:hypothetical protein